MSIVSDRSVKSADTVQWVRGGTVLHSIASSTIAPASSRPNP